MSDQDNEKCRKCAGSNADKTSDRMVQCDNCDKWYHFECVGVNSDIANVSWNCEFFESTTASTVMSAAAPSTTLIEHHAQTQISRMPQSSSPKQLQLPSQQYSTVPVFSTESATVVPPPPELVHEWKTAGALVYPSSALTVAANAHAQPFSIFTQPISSYRPQSSNVNGNAQPVSDLRYQSTSCAGNTSVGYQMPFGWKLSAFPHCTTSLPAHPNPYELHMSNPTPAQLAARQAIPKDLPHFSGDPEEWPIFISSFDNSTTIAGYSQVEHLIRLQRCLKGKAREMVKHKLLLPGMVPEIIRTLKMCFGRPEHILDRVLEKVRRLPHPKDRLESLIEFALCVSDICSTMEACQMEAHLHNPMLVRELMDKLPNQYKLSWAMYEKTDSIPVVKAFSNWIYQLAEAASSVVPAVSMTNRKSASLNTHTQVDNMQPRKVQCTLCGDSHKIWQCDQFKSFTTSQKWEAVKTNKLCRLCLNIHRRKCFISNECGIDGCNAKHHQLLHNHKIRANDDMAGSNITKQFRGAVVSAHSDVNEDEKVYFRIIPIKIHTSKGSVNSFAFLDEGSSVTLMDEGSSVTLMDEDMYNTLGLKGDKDPLCLRWTSNTTRIEETSHRVFVEISDNENHVHYKLQNVHTVRKLGLPTQTVNMGDIRRKYEHLREIPGESYENAKPAILIGADNWNLAVPLKIREGASNQPIAVKCRLGWALQGGYSSQQAHQLNIHSCECDYERRLNELHDAVKQQFQLETSTPVKLQSKEDLRATNILQDTCQMKDGHFEVGLLWRQDDTKLPVSYMTAYKRLMCLQRKCMRDPELKHSFQEQIDNLVTKGYARKLAPEELTTDPDRTWYLPIFTTLNPNKPGKARLVWDAVAKSNGCSLNDFILSGPDLLNSLVDILLAIRTGQVASCGDIAEMFHQINVHPDDMHAQRFLWLNENDDLHHPSVYVMRALTFGISCAPCIAHFVRDKNAEQFKEKYPRAVESIQHYHYVDDLIDTVDDEKEAIELAKQVRQIHANAGFNIRNWTSNRETVVSQLCNEATVAQPIMELSSTEKVLGMYWDPNKDVFKYIFRFARLNRDVMAADTIVTKRETLQVLMSIFDPLGLLCCYTIGLKILLQEIWRSGIGWDEELSTDQDLKWCQWKASISTISSVTIPRCYSSFLKDSSDIQLHIFVDAGESAYAAACYLRIRCDNHVEITLVTAKSKVAPLRPLSISRLELQAAVIGVRTANNVLKVLQKRRISIDSIFFWSDSKTVLKWLSMDPKRFQPFVMHRIGEILESTNVTQWKWVPSKINPADYATKVTSVKQLRWFSGPEFLLADQNEWPECVDLGPTDISEMRQHLFHITKCTLQAIPLNVEYFSDWRRLYRAVATFLFYIERLRVVTTSTDPTAGLSFDMIQKAKRILIQEAQLSEYRQEIDTLKRGNVIEKSSKLIALNVVLDHDDILRIRSRAEHFNSYEGAIVLPKGHHVSFLIVRYFHENLHHISHETAINNIKSKYYIPRLRLLYRTVRRMCQRCKNNYAAPNVPQMASLPAARLASFERPFTFVGIDYFGPFFVTVGRRREKRWGVIFTCLTVRAVHIEVAHSLDTSSCIMCIRNFTSRRGSPKEIYTDNGTNFKATEKVLKLEVKNIN